MTANLYGRTQGNQTDEFMQSFSGFARLIALTLGVLIAVWTVRRLHDLGRSGWYAFFLIPPFTAFLLAYVLFIPNKDENKWGVASRHWSLFGIKLKGAWRLIAAALVAVIMLYLAGLFTTFLLS